MTLRLKLSLSFAIVVVLGVGASLLAAERYLAYNARQTLRAELEHASHGYQLFLAERGARRVAEIRVVAEEPRLKAAVRTLEIDQATLEDVADELREVSGADLFTLTDRAGAVVADVSLPPIKELEQRPEFVASAKAGGGLGIWAHEGKLYQAVVRPLKFGADVTGFVVAGYRIGDVELEAARAQTGAQVALLLDGNVLARATRQGLKLEGLASVPTGESEQVLSGERFVVLKLDHPASSAAGAQVMLLQSLDEALAQHAVVRQTLLGIGIGALLLSMVVAVVLGASLTSRLQRLAAAAVEVGKGAARVKVDESGGDEVGRLAGVFNKMTEELEQSRAALVRKERLERELQIAQQIQTALLPKQLDVPGYRIAATMLPAENVGGDLYDVQVAKDGSVWLCIGDVTSHGVTPGLIMMMVQSALSALIDRSPDARPREMLVHLNRVIYENVHERLGDDNYLTLTLLRSDGPGKFIYAGAHLDLLVKRGDGKIDRLPTPGLWVGLLPDISHAVEESTVDLQIGDLLVLYSDGLTESRDAAGKQFDMDGVERVLSKSVGANGARDSLLQGVQAHLAKQDDDITVMVVERLV